jgi:DNA-binding LytR/AlgR family response regulator
MLKSIIIEDEVAAQEILSTYLANTPFVECVGIYNDCAPVPLAQLQQVHLVFLDLQLPTIHGMKFIESIPQTSKIIITTAHAHFAIDAFEKNVADYLLKPFSYERFYKAVSRVQTLLNASDTQQAYLYFYADKAHHKIFLNDILYIKAEVDYIKVNTIHKSLLVLDSLQNIETKLPSSSFHRIHRSYIINTTKITKYNANSVWIGDVELTIGVSYKRTLDSFQN